MSRVSFCLSVCDLVSGPKFGGNFLNIYYAFTKRCLAVPILSQIEPQKISCGLRPRMCKDGSSET
jgi:hypothetical protein